METEKYLTIADMMSGLMMVFLFIAIVFMLDVQASKNEIEKQKDAIEQQKNLIEQQKNAMSQIAEMAERSRLLLNQALMKEFKQDLSKWNAEILPNNTIRFKSPKILFRTGKSILRNKFQTILNDFFPRYITILQEYEQELEAIRIEGHTSSVWKGTNDVNESYIKNMQLSQKRALATLEYCYSISKITNNQQKWLRTIFRANGLSFAKPRDNAEKSRRVEFKVITKAEEKLYQILEKSRSPL